MRKRAGVVLINPGTEEILLMGRKKSNQDIYYVIPGGGVEENETYLEGARREMLEELDLKIGDMHYFFSKDKEVYYYFLTMEKKEFIIHGEESIRQNKDNLYIPTWVKIEDMKNMNIFPDDLFEEIQKLDLDKKA